jgi:WhiB family redox-sensing transcriptional regulator
MSSWHASTVDERQPPPVDDWPNRACRDVDPTVFYPEQRHRPDKARAICHSCPHQQDCLIWALDTRQRFGVWGGTTPDERRAILRKRRGAA